MVVGICLAPKNWGNLPWATITAQLNHNWWNFPWFGGEIALGVSDQMKMIVHQAICVNLPAGLGANFAQGGDEAFAVGVVVKDRLASILAIQHTGHAEVERRWPCASTGTRGEHHRRFAAHIRQAGGIPFLQGRPEQRHPARQQGGAHRRDQEMPPDPLGGRQTLAAGGFMNLTP
jgi:hypothetical protein